MTRIDGLQVPNFPLPAPSGRAGRACRSGLGELRGKVTHRAHASRARNIEPALRALETMMAEAERLNVRVCLATIPPQRGGSFPDRGAVAALIPGFNDQVRALAARRNAVLIDVFDGMKDDLSLIGRDNLHPTVRGYEVMAAIFEEGLAKAFLTRTPPAVYGAVLESGAPASRTMRSNGATR
jgi:GDSL-like Lipase/Acylhydrolase family